MTWKQAAVIALVVGLISAGIVWWLEEFNRQRMVDDLRSSLEEWDARSRTDAAGA